MKAEKQKRAEGFLDTYLGNNRNVSSLTWNHWVECLQDYADRNARLQIEKDREEVIRTCLLSQSGEAAKRIRNLPIILD